MEVKVNVKKSSEHKGRHISKYKVTLSGLKVGWFNLRWTATHYVLYCVIILLNLFQNAEELYKD